MNISAYIDQEAIKAKYAPHHTTYAFSAGYEAVLAGRNWLRHAYTGGREQAYDRGVQAACEVVKLQGWIDSTVGAD